MATEREHMDRAEELAEMADHYRKAERLIAGRTIPADPELGDPEMYTAPTADEIAIAQVHATLALAASVREAVRALTEVPDPLRPARTTRNTRTASGFPDLPVTKIGERP